MRGPLLLTRGRAVSAGGPAASELRDWRPKHGLGPPLLPCFVMEEQELPRGLLRTVVHEATELRGSGPGLLGQRQGPVCKPPHLLSAAGRVRVPALTSGVVMNRQRESPAKSHRRVHVPWAQSGLPVTSTVTTGTCCLATGICPEKATVRRFCRLQPPWTALTRT